MKLYAFIVAPNPTRVRLYIAEKCAAGAQISIPEIMVNLAEGEQREPIHLARNPLGALPVLELDDGKFLTESFAIIEYLEELYPEAPLLGASPLERAQIRELDRIVEFGVLAPISQIVHATHSPIGLPPAPEVAARARDHLPAALELLNSRLSDGRPFLAGDRPTVADCTLQAAFQFARFRDVEVDPSLEAIAHWDEAYRTRELTRSILVV